MFVESSQRYPVA